jgi:hypothetical protein
MSSRGCWVTPADSPPMQSGESLSPADKRRRPPGIEPESWGVALCHLVPTCVNTCRSGGIFAPRLIRLMLCDIALL